MSANQRRSGFRLPWLSDTDEPGEMSSPADAAATPEAPNAQPAGGAPQSAATNGFSAPAGQPAAAPDTTADAAAATPDAPAPPPAAEAPNAAPAARPSPPTADAARPDPDAASAAEAATVAAATSAEPPGEFLRELIAAMRKVADETRQAGVAKLRSQAEEAVQAMEADAEKRRQELRERAEADITGVGDWARAEVERIKAEAEQRVAARRSQLEQQLAAEGTRTEAETNALRARVDDYERELEAYYAQLAEITDPAAFAAAAKRMPAPPELAPRGPEPVAVPREPAGPAAPAAMEPTEAPTEPGAGVVAEVHPAEEEVLAARLAELDQKFEAAKAAEPKEPAEPREPAASAAEGAPVSTDIVVKGLGSFGAITGFRQSLSGQPGITAVALSLGQSGEFVFRATHAPGFDLAGAIKALEGDGATIEPRPEGGLRVTLERAR